MGKFGENRDIQRYAKGAQRQIPTLNVIDSILVFCYSKNFTSTEHRKY